MALASTPARKCLRCGHEWPASTGRTPTCPNCGSALWEQDLQIGARNAYEIRLIRARSDGSIVLELKLRDAGHMPNPALDGQLLRDLRAMAENLGVAIASLVGYTIEFDRSPSGLWTIGSLEVPRRAN